MINDLENLWNMKVVSFWPPRFYPVFGVCVANIPTPLNPSKFDDP